MPASLVGLPTVLASHRFADVTIDKFTGSEAMPGEDPRTLVLPEELASCKRIWSLNLENTVILEFGPDRRD